MQRLYPSNSGSNNGTHNRSIFTITQTLSTCLNISLSHCKWENRQCNSTLITVHFIRKQTKKCQAIFIYPFSTLLYILFNSFNAANPLQRVVRTARHIVGGELPSLQDIYTRRCIRKARRIINESSHPSHRLFSLLPSGRRLRSIRSCTSRLRDSFFPQAIRLMNSQN